MEFIRCDNKVSRGSSRGNGSLDENSIVRQALNISIDLYDNGKNIFYSNENKRIL